MRLRFHWFTTLLTVFLFVNMAISQDAAQDTIHLNEVVVTGSKQYRSSGNTTQKIDVIKSQEMQHLVIGNSNLAEALMMKPGASVSVLSRNDANWGTYAGIGPKYSTFMLNGLPLDAFTDPMALDLMAVERIEVQRGPASVLYPNYLSQDFAGNQSPLAGTVNLILKEKIEKQHTIFQTSYGSFNTINAQAYHQDKKDNLNYFGGVNFESSDYSNYGTENSWLNMQKDPEYEKIKLFAGASLYFGEKDENKLSVFLNNAHHQGDAGRVYRGFDHNYTTINVSQTVQFSEVMNLEASVGMRIYDRNWQESFFNEVDSLVSENGAFQQIIPADIHLNWMQGRGFSLVAGIDHQKAKYHTSTNPLTGFDQLGNKSRAMQTGVYLQQEATRDQLSARVGLRYNFIRTTIDLIGAERPGIGETDYQNLLWSVGAKYHLNASVSLFANAGNSFLPPGLKSMGGTLSTEDEGIAGMHGQLPNPDLVPESGVGFDFGANSSFSDKLKLSLRAFRMEITDAIFDIRISEDPSQSQSINAGSTQSTGIEMEANMQMSNAFAWFVNYTYLSTEVKNSSNSESGTEVPFAPEHIANAGLSINTDFGLRVIPTMNYNSGYFDSNSLSSRKKFVPGTLVNLVLSQIISEQKSHTVELFLRGYNLTNNKYELPWQFRNTGIAITGGVKITLQ